MSTIELRHLINEHLSHIDDISFLNALKTIIESKIFGGGYKLTEYQKTRVDMARKQLKTRQTISHEELQKEIDLWLKSK